MSAPVLTLPYWAVSLPILAAIECHVKRGISQVALPSMKAQDEKILADIKAMQDHLTNLFEDK